MNLIFCSNGIWCKKKDTCLRFEGVCLHPEKIYNSYYDNKEDCIFYIKKGSQKSVLIEKNNWKWI